MTRVPNLKEFIPYETQLTLGACVHRTMSSLEDEHTVADASPVTAIQRLLKVFTGIEPVLVFLTKYRVVPPAVRTAIMLLQESLEEVFDVQPAITAQFKAGKDLQEEA